MIDRDVENTKRLVDFVRSAKVVSKEQAIRYLCNLTINRHMTEEKAVRFIHRLVTNKMIVEREDYLLSSSNISTMLFVEKNGLTRKINDIYINLSNKFDFFVRECKYPCEALLINKEKGTAVNIFYLTHDDYANECNIIETLYASKMTEKKPLNVILILDDEIDSTQEFLSKNFNIVAVCQNEKLTSMRN